MPAPAPSKAQGVGIIGVVCDDPDLHLRRPARNWRTRNVQRREYVSAVRCNRWFRHDGPHMYRDPLTFQVLAKW